MFKDCVINICVSKTEKHMKIYEPHVVLRA